jgi:hypothetical protein
LWPFWPVVRGNNSVGWHSQAWGEEGGIKGEPLNNGANGYWIMNECVYTYEDKDIFFASLYSSGHLSQIQLAFFH